MPYVISRFSGFQFPAVRWTGLGLVALLHLGLIFMLVQVLAYRSVSTPPPPFQNIELAQRHTKATPPPPPKPNTIVLETPTTDLPLPAVNVAQAPASVGAIHLFVSQRPAPVHPAAAPARVVPPTVDQARSGDTSACYPALARRLGQEGAVLLQVLADPTGRVIDARVMRSSGFARLDAASVACAKEVLRMHPGTQNGKPVAAWGVYDLRFHLQ